jgi:hypothetical protein
VKVWLWATRSPASIKAEVRNTWGERARIAPDDAADEAPVQAPDEAPDQAPDEAPDEARCPD